MLLVLIVLEILLFLLLLVSLPIRVRVQARFSWRLGRLRVMIKLFGFIRIPLSFQVRLFSEPRFTLIWLRKRRPPKDFPLTKPGKKPKRKKGKKPAFIPNFSVDELYVGYTLGIRDDAAATVWALGLLRLLSVTAGEVLGLPLRVGLQPVFEFEVFRINLDGMVTIRLANSISNYWRERRKAYASR